MKVFVLFYKKSKSIHRNKKSRGALIHKNLKIGKRAIVYFKIIMKTNYILCIAYVSFIIAMDRVLLKYKSTVIINVAFQRECALFTRQKRACLACNSWTHVANSIRYFTYIHVQISRLAMSKTRRWNAMSLVYWRDVMLDGANIDTTRLISVIRKSEPML